MRAESGFRRVRDPLLRTLQSAKADRPLVRRTHVLLEENAPGDSPGGEEGASHAKGAPRGDRAAPVAPASATPVPLTYLPDCEMSPASAVVPGGEPAD